MQEFERYICGRDSYSADFIRELEISVGDNDDVLISFRRIGHRSRDICLYKFQWFYCKN